MRETWRIDEYEGVRVVRCLPLLDVPGVAHGFSTGDLDLGGASRDDPEIEGRRRAFCAAVGLAGRNPAILSQVHGNRLVRVADTVGERPRADGVIAAAGDPGNPVPAVRTADCAPILLADRDGAAVAAVHGGWRGAAAGIAGRAVAAMRDLGLSPRRLLVAIGPTIGRCCYRVGPEVVREVARACGAGQEAISAPADGAARLLDLQAAHRLQLAGAGIPAASVREAPWCTACHEERFFSYRRDGAGGGRQMACIGRAGLP